MSMNDPVSRRSALRLLSAVPAAAAVAGCSGVMEPLADAGDAPTDAGALGSDASIGLDGGGPDAGACEPTQADALGPFFESGAPNRMVIAAADEPGDRLLVEGSLVDSVDCVRPLSGYTIDIWQADVNGVYYGTGAGYRLRGRMTTAADGTFAVETIKPGFYETSSGPRPAHLHARVWTPGGAERLVTQLYFEGDAFLGPADGCQPPTCFSGDPARVLRLEPARVRGVDGLRGAIRLAVPA